MSTIGEIPQSLALAEASPDSLSELLARDPFSLQKQDRQKVVDYLRGIRANWEKMEASGENKKKISAPKKALSSSINTPIEELGL